MAPDADRRSRVLVGALGVVVACLGTLALAQIPGVTSVRSGMRLTFYSSSASVRGSSQQAVFKPNCDPSKEDCWTDAQGRSVGLQDVPTASGQGYTQLDVLHLDAQTCVLRLTSYLLDPSTGAVTTITGGGTVSTGGACSDYWIAPTSLQQMQAQDTGGLRVSRGPYQIGTLTFDAVSIGNFGAGSSSHSSYDAVTGLLVVASSRGQGSSVPTIQGNSVVAGAGSTMLTYTQLLGARSVAGAAIGEALPDHVMRASRLVYACTQSTAMSGMGAISIPCHYEVTLGQRTGSWVQASSVLQVSDGITLIPNVSHGEHVIAAHGHGGHFASPTLLSGYTAGTQLDADPITGVTATVEYVDDSLVAIVERSNAETKQFVYDRREGWLLRLTIEQRTPLGSFTTQYDLTEVQ